MCYEYILVYTAVTDLLCDYMFLCPEEGKRKVLQLKLSELVVVGTVEGSSLTINFSSSLDVLHAACSVFGQGKNKVGHGSLHPLLVTVLLGIFFMFFCDIEVCEL